MLKRALFCLFTLTLLLAATTPVAGEDPEYQHPDSDWLTWELDDAAGNDIDLSAYENQNTFVIVFSASDEKASKLMRKAAKYIRNHPAKAGKVLAMCCDDTGHDALKLHLRQEEWKKRVKEWEEEQEQARQEAEQNNEEFTPEPMPDFLEEIEDELEDPDDLEDLMDHHLPFNAGCRCEKMWDWLAERYNGSPKAPFILKVASDGEVLKQWPTPDDLADVMGN